MLNVARNVLNTFLNGLCTAPCNVPHNAPCSAPSDAGGRGLHGLSVSYTGFIRHRAVSTACEPVTPCACHVMPCACHVLETAALCTQPVTIYILGKRGGGRSRGARVGAGSSLGHRLRRRRPRAIALRGLPPGLSYQLKLSLSPAPPNPTPRPHPGARPHPRPRPRSRPTLPTALALAPLPPHCHPLSVLPPPGLPRLPRPMRHRAMHAPLLPGVRREVDPHRPTQLPRVQASCQDSSIFPARRARSPATLLLYPACHMCIQPVTMCIQPV